MSARGKARRRALDILFEAEIRGVDPNAVAQEHQARRVAAGQPPLNEYAVEAVSGVQEHLERIDEVITNVSIGWSLDRMPGVDRNVLRIAVWEILWRPDIPDAVSIDEAVEAVKVLSTDDSPGFVNGVLAQVTGSGVVP